MLAASGSLERCLEELRATMRARSPLPSGNSVPRRPAAPPGANATSSEIVTWLAWEVCRRAGIAVNESMRSKLDRIAGTIPQPELVRWSERLAGVAVDHPEWLSLVEMLTVHETYFLRDPGQFDFVRRQAMPEIIAGQANRSAPSIRLWSAACSTGEEAYSLAFLALEALMDAGEAEIDGHGKVRLTRRWTIDVLGSDLSRQAVRTAREGVYHNFGLGAFRNLPQGYWRFFEKNNADAAVDEPPSWRVRDDVRQMVRFQQFNLMSQDAPVTDVDAVFCRNVLIYFDQPGKDHVFSLIHRALKPGRFAVFGPTDIPGDPDMFKAMWGTSTVI